MPTTTRKNTDKPSTSRKRTTKPTAKKKAPGKATRRTSKGATDAVASTKSGSSSAAAAGASSLATGRHALDAAAATETKLRRKLKKHSKAIDAVHADLKDRDRDLNEMKAHLKTAKKSRKKATKHL